MLRRLVPFLCVLTSASAPIGPSAGPLPFFYDLYTFRGPGRSTSVVAAFAVPVRGLEGEEAEAGVRYRFDVSLVLADTALGSVSRTDDSVFVGFPRPPAGEHLLYTHVEVKAPPSSSTWQRVIMTDATIPGSGQLYYSSFPIPDYSGSHLMLSDVALGKPDARSGWRRGDVTLALLPTSQFPSSAFDVYYEIYNLPRGSRYVTEISVEHADGSVIRGTVDPRPVSIRFAGESLAGPDGSLPELRRVETSLVRGRYRITVTVTDETSGQTARRSRLFEVQGWERGATLVPALPRRDRDRDRDLRGEGRQSAHESARPTCRGVAHCKTPNAGGP